MMTFFWHQLLLVVRFALVKSQKLNGNLNPNSSALDALDDSQSTGPRVITLAAVAQEGHITLLQDATKQFNQQIKVLSQSFLLDSNPLLTTLKLCEVGNRSHAKVIIAGRVPDSTDLTLTAIAYVSDFYHIPVLTIGSRENIFSDKTLYDYMIRLVPPYLYEADAWFSIIRKLEYSKVVLIYSQEEESRMFASRFQMLTDDSEVQIERIEEYPFDTNFTSLIANLIAEDRLSARVFIIYTRVEDVDELLSAIVRLRQLENFAWIINERALTSNSSALFDGLLGVKLHDIFSEENLLIDALELISNTFRQFLTYPVAFWSDAISAINCSSTEPWSYGKEVHRAFINSNVTHGMTGTVAFNQQGDRLGSLYEVINIQYGRAKVVGTYRSNTTTCYTSSMCREIVDKTELKLDEDIIIWPNGLHRKPDGILTRRNVSVVTIVEKPFTFARPGNNCDSSSEVSCPRRRMDNATNEEYEQFCCYGYCIALLQELSKNLSFVFTLHLVADNKYGSYEKDGDYKQKRWDGMIGELINYQADMIIAPLTMSPERAQDIEFTKPFKYQGITILVQKNTTTSNLSSFLQPFETALWMMVLLCVHVVAVVLYLLDRFSPFGRYPFPPRPVIGQPTAVPAPTTNNDEEEDEAEEEDALNLSRALWFTWGILLNSGIGEGTPRSFSARVLGMVWAGFAMIMVASYTANLAAFLVLDRPEASISGINDARLRNPQDGFKYATVKGSAVDMYFKRQVELSTMYRTMESKNYLNVEEAIDDLKLGKLNAFIWDSPRLEYEAAQDCNLVTAGELFGRSSYGIALRKNDAWVNPISHAILSFHEKGFMELLDNFWIFSKNSKPCSDPSSSPATLGMSNMMGVFILILGGVVLGSFLLIVEIIFKRHKKRQDRETELSRTAIIHWKKIKRVRINYQEETVESDLHNEDSCVVRNNRGTTSNS